MIAGETPNAWSLGGGSAKRNFAMLLISRKHGESIRIGDDVIVTITSLGRGRVQLGIVAPKSVPVHRSEVYDKNKAKGVQDEQNNQ